MPKTVETPVLVVGGGPIGLTLAMDLAWRGTPVLVAELRERGEAPSVKCNHVSARSMEIFRRLGVAPKLRNAGLPADYPNDCSYRTTTTGIELARIPIPCRSERYTARGGPDTWWPTPEPPHRINQIFLEPILNEHAAGMRGLTILHRTSIDEFLQDEDGVVATARNLRYRRDHAHFVPLPRGMRRRQVGSQEKDRRVASGDCRSSSACSRATSAHRSCSQHASGKARVGHVLAQPAALRQRHGDRRA